MEKKGLIFLLLFIPLCSSYSEWGFFGHEKINEYAIYLLPIELRPFYKSNKDAVVHFSTLPDKRRYAVKEEGGRHFMDMEFYFKNLSDTQAIFNLSFKNLQERFLDTINETGYAYWNLLRKYDQLVTSFKFQDTEQLIKLSGEIGHYIGDIHVPLHTTENYNGQLTGQKGIHGVWETLLLKEEWEGLIEFLPNAMYIKDKEQLLQSTILRSHHLVKEVLLADSMARALLKGKIYRGNDKVYNNLDLNARYIHQVRGSQTPILKERMEKAIFLTASFWYSAWMDAGAPSFKSTQPMNIKEDEYLLNPKDSLTHKRSHIH